MCAGQLCQIGTHQFSLDGGRQWFYTGTAYTSLVHYTDGSSHLFDRRERPHMVFAENSTTPIALSNSARPGVRTHATLYSNISRDLFMYLITVPVLT